MKKILVLIVLFLWSNNFFAQNSALENEFVKFEQSHKDSINPVLYIGEDFYSKYGLKSVSQKQGRMQVWSHPLNFDSPDFMRIGDIRWVFKTHQEAMDFHAKYLQVNAEYGEEINMYKFKIPKVDELRVFKESEKTKFMNAEMGFPMNFYYFIFVKDRVVAKVFVNTVPSITVEQASVFAKEAARRVATKKSN
ncbi:MAG: hypothetical protein IT236_12790 [Bacteroidia bacterium]|nr:hypothetical protein [Bacteroidia bacterium]